MTNRPEYERVRKAIYDLITDSPCRGCEFWKVQWHYCLLRDMHESSQKCKLLNQILVIPGLRIEADDQSLPFEVPEDKDVVCEGVCNITCHAIERWLIAKSMADFVKCIPKEGG